MNVSEFIHAFWEGLRATSAWEAIAVIAGIVSVYFSQREHVLVYPTGLINTIIYIYLSYAGGLIGEASVNFYYTVMSIYGWFLWTRTNNRHEHVWQIRFSNKREWLQQLLFFAVCYGVIFFILQEVKKGFAPGAIPWADALASATAYTGMWLMARKKVESWYWWIATNLASIPLYATKGYAFTSVYYLILFFMAVVGLISWKRKANAAKAN